MKKHENEHEQTEEGNVNAPENSSSETDSFLPGQKRPLARKDCVRRKCCAPHCLSTNLTSKLYAFPCIQRKGMLTSEESLER